MQIFVLFFLILNLLGVSFVYFLCTWVVLFVLLMNLYITRVYGLVLYINMFVEMDLQFLCLKLVKLVDIIPSCRFFRGTNLFSILDNLFLSWMLI
jgi:hypothetical protein